MFDSPRPAAVEECNPHVSQFISRSSSPSGVRAANACRSLDRDRPARGRVAEKKAEAKPAPAPAAAKPAAPAAPADDPAKLKAQIGALEQEVTQLKLKVASLELEKLGATVNIDKAKGRQGHRHRQHPQEMVRWQGRAELLKNVPNLQVVYIDNTQVDDAALLRFRGSPGLSALTIMSPGVTDKGLDTLKGLSNLNMLFLTSSKVSDKGLAQLKGLKNLQVLALSKTDVTDAGLDTLKEIKSLKSIYLDRHEGYAAGDREAQAGRPGVAVYK